MGIFSQRNDVMLDVIIVFITVPRLLGWKTSLSNLKISEFALSTGRVQYIDSWVYSVALGKFWCWHCIRVRIGYCWYFYSMNFYLHGKFICLIECPIVLAHNFIFCVFITSSSLTSFNALEAFQHCGDKLSQFGLVASKRFVCNYDVRLSQNTSAVCVSFS